jgi:hypothetical protein
MVEIGIELIGRLCLFPRIGDKAFGSHTALI